MHGTSGGTPMQGGVPGAGTPTRTEVADTLKVLLHLAVCFEKAIEPDRHALTALRLMVEATVHMRERMRKHETGFVLGLLQLGFAEVYRAVREKRISTQESREWIAQMFTELGGHKGSPVDTETLFNHLKVGISASRTIVFDDIQIKEMRGPVEAAKLAVQRVLEVSPRSQRNFNGDSINAFMAVSPSNAYAFGTNAYEPQLAEYALRLCGWDDADFAAVGRSPEDALPKGGGLQQFVRHCRRIGDFTGSRPPEGTQPPPEPRKHSVTSHDGTQIAYWEIGQGPPVVLVHGTNADHTRWAPVLAKLGERFTVFAMDRRGSGSSEDAGEYALEREFEDVAAVVDAVAGDGKAHLLGDSHGAICALEAALRTEKVDKLILYEPPIAPGVPIYPPATIERLDDLLTQKRKPDVAHKFGASMVRFFQEFAGNKREVVETFLREIVRMPRDEIAKLKGMPSWPDRILSAHTIPRELRADGKYVLHAEQFRALRVPTLLLVGSASPAPLKAAIESVESALPGSRVQQLPGQDHTAINTAPDVFVGKVLWFLAEG